MYGFLFSCRKIKSFWGFYSFRFFSLRKLSKSISSSWSGHRRHDLVCYKYLSSTLCFGTIRDRGDPGLRPLHPSQPPSPGSRSWFHKSVSGAAEPPAFSKHSLAFPAFFHSLSTDSAKSFLRVLTEYMFSSLCVFTTFLTFFWGTVFPFWIIDTFLYRYVPTALDKLQFLKTMAAKDRQTHGERYEYRKRYRNKHKYRYRYCSFSRACALWGQGVLSASIVAALPASRTHLFWVERPPVCHWSAQSSPAWGARAHWDVITCSLSLPHCVPSSLRAGLGIIYCCVPVFSTMWLTIINIQDGDVSGVSPRTERWMTLVIGCKSHGSVTPSFMSLRNVTSRVRSP